MNDTAHTMDWKAVFTTILISFIIGLLLTVTYVKTKEPIARNQQKAVQIAVQKVFSGTDSFSAYEVRGDGTIAKMKNPSDESPKKFFASYKDGKLIGLAIPASATGFKDAVGTLFGYRPEDECVIGFQVLKTSETPGIGDKILKDKKFLASFQCLSVKVDPTTNTIPEERLPSLAASGKERQAWQVDGITGATYTSKAVVNGIRESVKSMMKPIRDHLAQIEANQ